VLTDEPSTPKHAARGALLGAACGDAMGAPFEGSRAVSRILVENWMTSARAMRYTDDTALTLVLARHLITSGGMIEEDRLARDFAEEWQSEPDRGYGAGPPRIFRAVLSGENWGSVARSAFQGTGSWGNGGAMRVAPVALSHTRWPSGSAWLAGKPPLRTPTPWLRTVQPCSAQPSHRQQEPRGRGSTWRTSAPP